MQRWIVLSAIGVASATAGCAPELRLSDPVGAGTGGGGVTSSGGEVKWARALDGDREQDGPRVAVAGNGSAVLLGRLAGDLALDEAQVSAVGVENIFLARLALLNGAGLGLKRFGVFDPQVVNAVSTDINGDLLVGGEFSGKMELGGAQETSTGGRDGYVARLAPEGDKLWLKPLGGLGFQAVTGAAGSADGETVVVGRFTGALRVDTTTLKSAGGHDVFVARFDAGGGLLWCKGFGDGFDQRSTAVAVDADGNAVVVGEFAGEIDLGAGPLRSAGDYDVFVAKLDRDGKPLWSRRFGDAGPQRVRAVAVDGAGDVIVGGEFTGAIDFGGGPQTAGEGTAVFVAKLSRDGEHRFSRRIGGQGEASLGHLVVDGAGNVIVTGSFRGRARLAGGEVESAGGDDVVVAKLDPEGRFLWSHRFGGAGADRGTGVALDADGSAIVTGAFEGRVDFGGVALDSGASAGVFAMKIAP